MRFNTMWNDSRILIDDQAGMIGAALTRALTGRGLGECIIDSNGLDTRDRAVVRRFLQDTSPTHVFAVGGRKGGIAENQRIPADLLVDNLQVVTALIGEAAHCHTPNLLYLASSCIYPRDCSQPMREDQLWSGPPEPTSDAYSTAKLAGLMLCRAISHQSGRRFLCAIPTNVYGPGDDFDPERAHVVGSLIRRMITARDTGEPTVRIWGTGRARREFIHCDDLADALCFVMDQYHAPEPVNIGVGSDVSIAELAIGIQQIVGYTGELIFDTSRPDGMPRKWLDAARLTELGWRPRIGLAEGLEQTCRWFQQSLTSGIEEQSCKTLC